MTARPNLSSIPARGITIDGIVDVLGGKSIVVGRLVSATNASALKGEVLVVDGAGAVKTAAADAAKATVAGVAVSSAVTGEIISVLRHGIARLVVHASSSALAVGDEVAIYAIGQVCKNGDNSTTNAIGEVSSVGDGYVDVEINFLGAAV
jgi:hypothetical protein